MTSHRTTLASPANPGSVSYGASLVFEDLTADAGAPRLHPDADALLRVVTGMVHLVTTETERILRTGDEVIVPSGIPHELSSVGGVARIITGLRPLRG